MATNISSIADVRAIARQYAGEYTRMATPQPDDELIDELVDLAARDWMAQYGIGPADADAIDDLLRMVEDLINAAALDDAIQTISAYIRS